MLTHQLIFFLWPVLTDGHPLRTASDLHSSLALAWVTAVLYSIYIDMDNIYDTPLCDLQMGQEEEDGMGLACYYWQIEQMPELDQYNAPAYFA